MEMFNQAYDEITGVSNTEIRKVVWREGRDNNNNNNNFIRTFATS